MTIANPHNAYGVTINEIVLGGVISCGCPMNTEVRGVQTDGNVYGRFQSMFSQAPTPTFTTHSVAAALAIAGVEGLKLDSTSTLTLFAQHRAQGSTRVSTNTHQSFVVTNGILVPTSISVSQDGDATISYVATAIYDGTNETVIITGAATLPATTDAERFGIGKCWIEDIAISNITNITIDFGINVGTLFADGDVRPTFSSIDSISSTISITTIDPTQTITSIPIAGLLGTKANTSIFLRKRELGNKYYADNTSNHLKFVASGMITTQDAFSASGTAVGETTYILTAYDDGTNTPITVTPAQVIVTPSPA